MLDHLGENVETPCRPSRPERRTFGALGPIEDAEDLDATISVKLTQLGLDDAPDICWANLAPILDAAARSKARVMIDMESHAYVDATLATRRAHTSATSTPGLRSRPTCYGRSAICSSCPPGAGCGS